MEELNNKAQTGGERQIDIWQMAGLKFHKGSKSL